MIDFGLNRSCDDGGNTRLFQERIKAFHLETVPTLQNVGVIINPELAPNILEHREAQVINYCSVFTEKKVDAVKQVIVNIVHQGRSAIVGVDFLHFVALITRKGYTLEVEQLNDVTKQAVWLTTAESLRPNGLRYLL